MCNGCEEIIGCSDCFPESWCCCGSNFCEKCSETKCITCDYCLNLLCNDRCLKGKNHNAECVGRFGMESDNSCCESEISCGSVECVEEVGMEQD